MHSENFRSEVGSLAPKSHVFRDKLPDPRLCNRRKGDLLASAFPPSDHGRTAVHIPLKWVARSRDLRLVSRGEVCLSQARALNCRSSTCSGSPPSPCLGDQSRSRYGGSRAWHRAPGEGVRNRPPTYPCGMCSVSKEYSLAVTNHTHVWRFYCRTLTSSALTSMGQIHMNYLLYILDKAFQLKKVYKLELFLGRNNRNKAKS